jgi:hypothetical protein
MKEFVEEVKSKSNKVKLEEEIDCILFIHAAKVFGICNKSNSKLTALFPQNENLGNFSKKPLKLNVGGNALTHSRNYPPTEVFLGVCRKWRPQK